MNGRKAVRGSASGCAPTPLLATMSSVFSNLVVAESNHEHRRRHQRQHGNVSPVSPKSAGSLTICGHKLPEDPMAESPSLWMSHSIRLLDAA